MLIHAASYFALSVLALVGLSVFVGAEQNRGQRFFAASMRTLLDGMVTRGEANVAQAWEHFTKYVVGLGWYYSFQSVLQACVAVLRRGYEGLESYSNRQRERSRQLQAEHRELHAQNHLRQMAEHKAGVALTPAQQRKLKQKKLEERH